MNDLASRVEAAEEASRELDRKIAAALQRFDSKYPYSVATFTASLNAAMSLVPEGVEWGVWRDNEGRSFAGVGSQPEPTEAATPALALTAAALRHLQQGASKHAE